MDTPSSNIESLPRSLLVVDDDELSLTLMAERLTAAGYSVTTAHDGLHACEILQQQSFPMVISDYRMPVMDGAELVKRVRQRSGDGSYCIMWTMCNDDVDRVRSFKNGVDDHLSKRVTDGELLARVEAGFKTMEKRRSLQRTRRFMAHGMLTKRRRDQDVGAETWNSVASHLHAEMVLAVKDQSPLSILMLHVERRLIPNKTSVRASTQINELVHSLQERVRQGIDLVLPLDVDSGLARILIVLPSTTQGDVGKVRDRLALAISESVMTDEYAELQPDCAVGTATFETAVQPKDMITNAAEFVSKAETHMEKLLLPMMMVSAA